MKELTTQQRLEVADKCGIGTDYLYQVLTRRKIPSAELSVSIEKATLGVIGRRDLRPDDWHRIWPELDGKSAHAQKRERKKQVPQDAIKDMGIHP